MNKDLACIFDLDGVLVDTARYHFLSWIKLSNALNFEIDPLIEEELKGISRMRSLEIVLKAGGVEATEAEKVRYAEQKNKWYLESLVGLSDKVILPGVIELLEELKELGIKMAVGSSSKNAAFLLEGLEMTEYFVSIVDGLKVLHDKPHPEVFLNAARDLQMAPEKIIVFEDSIKGLKAAITGGFLHVGIGNPKILEEASHVIPNFQKIKFRDITMALGLK